MATKKNNAVVVEKKNTHFRVFKHIAVIVAIVSFGGGVINASMPKIAENRARAKAEKVAKEKSERKELIKECLTEMGNSNYTSQSL